MQAARTIVSDALQQVARHTQPTLLVRWDHFTRMLPDGVLCMMQVTLACTVQYHTIATSRASVEAKPCMYLTRASGSFKVL